MTDSVSSDTELGCIPNVEEDLSSLIEATTTEAKVELVTSIVENILPDLMLKTNSSLSPEENLRVTFISLANRVGQRPTEGGLNRFKEAINEISVAKNEACTGSKKLNQADAPQLIREFIDAYKMERKDRHQLRSLYGKLLCVNSTGDIHSRGRRDSHDCECPPDGLDGDFKFHKVCEFFACLDPGDVFKKIFLGFDQAQCLAFVVDTTGSMTDEIGTARNITLNFVRSEEEIGLYGCYILVPFNDVGPDDATVHEESKTILIL